MSNAKKSSIAQLELLDGLPTRRNVNNNSKGERVRMTFDRQTNKRLRELTKKDRNESKKNGHKGNWYPKDTLKKMIDDRYEQMERWG